METLKVDSTNLKSTDRFSRATDACNDVGGHMGWRFEVLTISICHVNLAKSP